MDVECLQAVVEEKKRNPILCAFVYKDGTWVSCESRSYYEQLLALLSYSDTFLCLPDNHDACLHWLNGGKVQESECKGSGWFDVVADRKWSKDHYFMNKHRVLLPIVEPEAKSLYMRLWRQIIK